MIEARAYAGLICSLWIVGLSHAVYGQVASENDPASQSKETRVSPKYLPASADLQAPTKVAGGPFEWSASDRQLIVKPALLVLHEDSTRSFEVRLSSVPVGNVTVVVSVPTRLDGKLIPSEGRLRFTASNFDQFQEVSVSALPGSDTGDKEEVITLEASGGGYNSVETSVPIYVDQDECAYPGFPYWVSVNEGTSCAASFQCADHGLGVGDYVYVYHVNGSATPGADLIVNTLESLEVTTSYPDWGTADWTTSQLVAPADGIPEGDETLGCHCSRSLNPPDPDKQGSIILILDADGWAVGDTVAAESSGEMTFLLKFPKPVARDLTVSYETEDGSATAGDDYDSRTDSVTVQKGETSAEIRVPIIHDDIAEGEEEFKLVTWSNQFRGIGRQTSTGRILEPGIQLQPNPLEVEEGNSATYRARLAMNPSDEVTVAISGYTGTDVRLVEPTSLTFMPFDFGWKDVKVNTDIDADSNPDKVTLTHTASGAPEYAGVTADLEVTILDRYAVELKVTPTVLALKENGSDSEREQEFTVRLGSPPVGGEVKVAISVADALQNKVSLSESGPLTFDASSWDKAQWITVTALDDADSEDESGTVVLAANGGGYDGKIAEVQIGVTDDDIPHRVDLMSQVLVKEGTGPARIQVRLNRERTAEVSVHYTTRSGTATEGSDYEHTSNTLTFAPGGGLAQWIDVPIVDDRVHEKEESFRLVLLNVEGAELGNSVGTVTIQDNDLAPTFRTVPAAYVREGGVAKVHVRLSNASSQPVIASYSTEDVTARGGKDYQSEVAGAITIGAGDMEAVIEVATHDDAEHEGRESFVVQLDGGGRIVITILDNDSMPGLSVEDVTVSEGVGQAKVAVTLDGASAVRVGVAYATQDGTATAGEDYTRAMGTLVFAPGEVKREVLVAVHQDEVLEEDETFGLRLSSPEHAQLLDGEAIVTIVDDPLAVSIYDGTGAESTEDLVLPVRLNYSSSQVVSAQFAVTGGTATPDVDFESTQGVVVFEPGSVEAQVRIPLKDDGLVEGDETVEVTLSDPRNAVLGQATATGTITDDETVPGVQVRARTPTAREAVFVITAAEGQVRYQTMDGTAWAGEDYERTEGVLEFGSGGE